MPEHVRLTTQEDYYSRVVTVGDFVTRFKIRELPDQVVKEAAEIERQMRELAHETGMTEEEAVRLLPLMLDEPGLSPEEQREALEVARNLAERLAEVPVEKQDQLVALQRRRRDLIITAGLVGWDIPDTPFSAEAAVCLPEWVKAELIVEILADTNMPERGVAFLARRPRQ